VCAVDESNRLVPLQAFHEFRRANARRIDIEHVERAGFDAHMSGGSFFLYVEAPKGIKGGKRFKTGEEFSQYLIKEMMISTVPWDDVGHFTRFSATFAAKGVEEETRIINEIKSRLSSVEFEF